jgi:hypothetical protein
VDSNHTGAFCVASDTNPRGAYWGARVPVKFWAMRNCRSKFKEGLSIRKEGSHTMVKEKQQ